MCAARNGLGRLASARAEAVKITTKDAARRGAQEAHSPLVHGSTKVVQSHMEDLQDMTREQLIKLLTERRDGGVKLEFSGKANARKMARKVRPRVQRSLKTYSIGAPEAQSRNLIERTGRRRRTSALGCRIHSGASP